jgi:hypothetical protein
MIGRSDDRLSDRLLVAQVIEAFERPTLALVLTVVFQLTAAVASIGRVRTSNYIASRGFNALALGAVAADFAVKYFVTGRGDADRLHAPCR